MLMETSVPTPNFEPKKKNVAGVRLEEFLWSFDSILLPLLAGWHPNWGKKTSLAPD